MDDNCEMWCGMHIKTLAKTVAIVGLILSVCSLLLNIFAWLYLPMSISLIVAFILVLAGISNSNPKFLLVANILITINVVIEILIAVFAIILATNVPQSYVDDANNNSSNNNNFTKSELQVGFYIVAFACIIIIGMLIFAIVVFFKTRQNLIRHTRHCAGPHVVYNFAPQPPPPAYPPYGYGTNCPPQGYVPNTTSVFFQAGFTNGGYQQQQPQQYIPAQIPPPQQQPPTYDSTQLSMWNNPPPENQPQINGSSAQPNVDLNLTNPFAKY